MTIDLFNENGVVFPIKAFSEKEINDYRLLLEYEIDHNKMFENEYRCKSLVLLPWIDEIAHNSLILDLVETILGPNFFCWDTQCWLKEPNDKKFVSWHQDATYWNFKIKKGVIVWLAFNDVESNMGPVLYKVGSHKQGQLKHSDVLSSNNILKRGQTLIDECKYTSIERLEIKKGCISIHHPYIVHGSEPNLGFNRRIGYSLQYIAADSIPLIDNSVEYGTLVRGRDDYNYLQHSPRPTGNINVDYVNWKNAFDSQRNNYLRMKNAEI